MTQDLMELDGVAQAALVETGKVSALELVDAAIARIERVEPKIHALASTDFEAARTRAKQKLSGPFAGVPFLIKDLLAYPGQSLTFGARLFQNHVAQAGSPYSARIDEAGLIPLGKTTTSELGLLGSTESLLLGKTNNPWDLTKSALGSSGGSAAAVASGMVPFAHASDGGGSIRIPASAAGLFGFKPGRGRCVSNGQPDPAGIVIEHCVSRSVRDSALFLSVTEEQVTGVQSVGYVQTPVQRPLRIGFYERTLMGRAPDPEVQRALGRTVALCRELGHELIEASPPPVSGPELSEAFFTWAGAGLQSLSQMMQGMLGRGIGPDDLEPFTLSLIEWYRSLPGGAMQRALATIERTALAVHGYLAPYDAVLCPTLPILPWDLGMLSPELDRGTLISRTELLAGYTPVYSMAGVPAMSVPLAMSSTGLPIGSHFAARQGQEALLFGLAYQLEQAAPWAQSWPLTNAKGHLA